MDDLLHDSLLRLFAQHATAAHVRAVEAGGTPHALWAALQEQGIADCLVSQDHGGAGLALRDLFGVVALMGEVACPVPLAATMVARGVLAGQVKLPDGPITIAAFGVQSDKNGLRMAQVPLARTARWVLAETAPQQALLLPLSAAQIVSSPVSGSLAADLFWKTTADAQPVQLTRSLRPTMAAVLAAMMAGAMARVQSLTTQYANDRIQFGKPIAKFQAIQQQLAELAEEVAATRMAAQIGMSSDTEHADPSHAAVAKMRASLAVSPVCAISHAVHGAMGITQAYDLQLFTRRLHEWRMACGSEIYWSGELGARFLAGNDSFLDHIRKNLAPVQ